MIIVTTNIFSKITDSVDDIIVNFIYKMNNDPGLMNMKLNRAQDPLEVASQLELTCKKLMTTLHLCLLIDRIFCFSRYI